jgi:F0F1-type ATP synthase assembly protein I
MPSDDTDNDKRRSFLPGFGGIPPLFDVALRWGLTLALTVLAGFFIGRWVDMKLGTTPLFLIIGVMWGAGGSFYSLYLQVKKLQDEEETKDKPPDE